MVSDPSGHDGPQHEMVGGLHRLRLCSSRDRVGVETERRATPWRPTVSVTTRDHRWRFAAEDTRPFALVPEARCRAQLRGRVVESLASMGPWRSAGSGPMRHDRFKPDLAWEAGCPYRCQQGSRMKASTSRSVLPASTTGTIRGVSLFLRANRASGDRANTASLHDD